MSVGAGRRRARGPHVDADWQRGQAAGLPLARVGGDRGQLVRGVVAVGALAHRVGDRLRLPGRIVGEADRRGAVAVGRPGGETAAVVRGRTDDAPGVGRGGDVAVLVIADRLCPLQRVGHPLLTARVVCPYPASSVVARRDSLAPPNFALCEGSCMSWSESLSEVLTRSSFALMVPPLLERPVPGGATRRALGVRYPPAGRSSGSSSGCPKPPADTPGV